MSETPWRTRQDDIDMIEREKLLVAAAIASCEATKEAAGWARVAALGAVLAAVGSIAGAVIMWIRP